jgi:nucleoside-diphosphate-sugar epimerase
MRVGLTGAGGHLGGVITEEARARGHTVVRMDIPRVYSECDTEALAGLVRANPCDALVHCAAARNPRTRQELYLNAQLPHTLSRAYHSIHADRTFIHVSSINVLVRGLTDRYTESKRRAERALDDRASIIVRPSLIWSAQERGAAGRLRDFLLRMPVSCMVFPGNRHLPVLDSAVAAQIVTLAETASPSRVVNVIGDTAVTLWQLGKHVAASHDRRLIPVPIPFRSRRLPKLLRHTDYTNFDEAWVPRANDQVVLPFTLNGPPPT